MGRAEDQNLAARARRWVWVRGGGNSMEEVDDDGVDVDVGEEEEEIMSSLLSAVDARREVGFK